MDRYARQRLLAAVGDPGQERIAAATYVVHGVATPSEVERSYLLRAGAERFAPAAGEPVTFAHRAAFKHAAARDFAEGAWQALVQLNRALDEG